MGTADKSDYQKHKFLARAARPGFPAKDLASVSPSLTYPECARRTEL